MNFIKFNYFALKNLNNIIIQLVIVLIILFSHVGFANADLHIVYDNKSINGQKYEIFAKIGYFKSINAQNKITIVDFDKKCLYLSKEGSQNYLKLPLKDVRANLNKERKEIFAPKLRRTQKQEMIAGMPAHGYTYTSSIDEKVELLVSKNIGEKMISTLADGIMSSSYSGNELVKQPAYFYSLKNDMVPLSLKNKDYHWVASVVDEKELELKEFELPTGTELSAKDYMKEVVDKVSKDVESSQKP